MNFEFEVEVGMCVRRPPTPANTRPVWVRVQADSEMQAHLAAAQIVGGNDVCVMVTYTHTVEVSEC